MGKDLRTRLKGEELRNLYLTKKKSLEDIARLYGASRVAVWKYCKAEGLARRNRSEARLEAQKKGKVPQNYYEINEGFFSKWSPEMAYILGLLMTDGCLSRVKRGSYRISLCLNDKELLESAAKAMSSNHTIAPSGHQKGLHLLIIGRQKISRDLMKLGMKPRKSLDLDFPNVPKQYLKDFIRGVFDGDGSVFFEKRSPKHPLRVSFISGSRRFIETLENKLRVLGMPKRTIYQHKTKNAMLYMIRYAHLDSVRIFNLFYSKRVLENDLFLARKYDKFLSGINCGE